jgi:hypothetical protein
MTSRLIVSTVVAVVLLASDGPAAGPVQSGPPVGAANNRSGFFPQFVAGPSAGKSMCPV